MKTIQLTNEQYEALQNGESITIAPPKPEQWQQQGGDWFVHPSGCVTGAISSSSYQNFGVERLTKELAEKACDAMRIHNRLLAYVHEFAPKYNPDAIDQRERKYFVFFDKSTNKWYCNHTYASLLGGAVCMPHDVAKELVRKLNSGEVVL